MTAFQEKYKFIKKIGEGSFSDVLKCEDKVTGTHYAAKRLKKCFKTIKEVMNCAEIIAMHKLARHPNIVYMIEYFYEATTGKLIYVFELMDMSMYEFMKSRRKALPESRIKYFLFQMLKGLEHLHRHGLFHRDIKPENILVKINQSNNSVTFSSEIVKLADLGSIRGVYSRQPYTEYISTRWYRSPECLLSVGYYGPKMDIWATGCVFYEMLTLKPLFPGSNEIDQLSKIHTVLGTPSTRLISKVKKKSHNCQEFPRQIGCGLTVLMKRFSEDGQNILKLMIQYDPDLRTNVRRLVEHRYFTPLRQQYLISQFRFNSVQDSLGLKTFSKARGDHQQAINYISNSDRWKQHKSSELILFKVVSEGCYSVLHRGESKGESVDSVASSLRDLPTIIKYQNISPRFSVAKAKRSMEQSATSTDLRKTSPEKSSKKKLTREDSFPVVTEEQLRDWGVNQQKNLNSMSSSPVMYSPRKGSKESKTQHRFQQTSRAYARPEGTFRKTTSNLPSTSANFTEASCSTEKQYKSKSFVLPRRAMGKIKLDTINEDWSSKMMKTIKKEYIKRNK